MNLLLLLLVSVLLAGCSASAPGTADDTDSAAAAQQITVPAPQAVLTSSPQDMRITEDLRKDLLNDASISVNGRNIIISTVNGNITLRGAVDDQTEKDAIVAKANGIPGVKSVTSQLEPQSKSLASGTSTIQ